MKEGTGAVLKVARTGDGEDSLARALPHVLQHQKGQPGEMIAMKMADEQQIETISWDAIAFERDRRYSFGPDCR